MNALSSVRGAKARARRGARSKVVWKVYRGSADAWSESGKRKKPEVRGKEFIRVLLKPGVRHGPRQ